MSDKKPDLYGLERERMETPKTRLPILIAIIITAVLLFLWMLFAQRVEEEGIELSTPWVFALAIIPALVLIFDVWRQDKIEKEPLSLMLRLFFFGALMFLPAYYLEDCGIRFLAPVLEDSPELLIVFAIYGVLVPVVEETLKYLVLRLTTWRHVAFNFRYDGLVYAVVVSLGFAAIENLGYVWENGVAIGLFRAVTAVALHCITGVFMGYYYGLAKQKEGEGRSLGKRLLERKDLILALLVPILLHGLYDFVASCEGVVAYVGFFIMLAAFEILGIRKVRRAARSDMQIR